MKITLKGRIPSKKNSKFIAKRGNKTYLLPKPEYTQWQQEQSWILKPLKRPELDFFEIKLEFYFPDHRKTDLTNKAESIMDLLVDNLFLKDDSWQFVPKLTLISKGVDKENPRVEIEFIPISEAPEQPQKHPTIKDI